MIIDVNDDDIIEILSKIVEHLDYDIWKNYFVERENPDEDADRRDALMDLWDVAYHAMLND